MFIAGGKAESVGGTAVGAGIGAGVVGVVAIFFDCKVCEDLMYE